MLEGAISSKMVGCAGTNNGMPGIATFSHLRLNMNLIQTVQVTPEKYSRTALHIKFITLK